MKQTLSTGRQKTKKLARNFVAGSILATTVASTDLVENLSTSITKPTANILHTIENTSQALGNTLAQTSQWNILHTAWNIVTFVPRAVGSVAEWWLKTVWNTTQYLSGLNQTVGNSYITTWENINQTFSTSDASPDIAHKEVTLNDATDLGRNGDHGVLGKEYQGSKYKLIRRMNNVKSSAINSITNTLRVGTDLISAGAQRIRWVVESIGQVPKDIKSSRSGVFTKWQSFGTKFKKFFTEGMWGSAKWVGKGVLNIANEWIVKTGAATIGVSGNFLWRMRSNTIKPLFSTTPRKDQVDNVLSDQSRFQKLESYYTSTPRKKTDTTKEEKKEDQEKKDESTETKSSWTEETKKEGASDSNEWKKEKKSRWSSRWPFGKKKTEEKANKEDKKETKATKKAKEANTETDNKKTEEKLASKSTDEKKETTWKNDTETQWNKKTDETKKNEKEQSQIESNNAMRDYINQEQQRLTKHYNNKEKIEDDDIGKWLKSIQSYVASGWEVVFTGQAKADGNLSHGKLTNLIVEDNKVKAVYIDDTTQKEAKDEIDLNKVFSPDFSFHLPGGTGDNKANKKADTWIKENKNDDQKGKVESNTSINTKNESWSEWKKSPDESKETKNIGNPGVGIQYKDISANIPKDKKYNIALPNNLIEYISKLADNKNEQAGVMFCKEIKNGDNITYEPMLFKKISEGEPNKVDVDDEFISTYKKLRSENPDTLPILRHTHPKWLGKERDNKRSSGDKEYIKKLWWNIWGMLIWSEHLRIHLPWKEEKWLHISKSDNSMSI